MNRIGVLKVCFLVLASAIVVRSVQLQLGADPRLAKLAHRQFQSKATAMPRRGLIFDRNGEGLAISLKVYSLFFRPELMRKELIKGQRHRVLGQLSRILHIPSSTLSTKMHSDKGFVWIKRQLAEVEEKAIRDEDLLEYGDGIGLVEETKRFYPNKELASHVLGSVNVDGQGLEGLELFYEGILNGDRMNVSSTKDAMGRRIYQDEQGLHAFKDGQTLVLTLDKAVQYEAEKSLKQALEDHKAKAGTVIVAEVATGEILAMANFPTFDSNNPKRFAADSRRNRAITDSYEPGSTFKPFVVALALEKGRSPKTKVYCEKGLFKVGDRKISEAETHEKYEWLTYGEILKFSSNIGAAKLALDLGPAAMSAMMDRLGIGHRTEIDLPGEAAGYLSHKELSSQVRLANIGFGHGFTVTPLQMLTYYLAVANGGKWVQPKLVKAILSEDPDSLQRGSIRWKLGHRFDTLKDRRLFTQTIASQLTAMLATVVEEKGTGTQAQLEEWPVAGKTGTAQKIDPDTKRYSHTRYIPSFVGFAPVSDPKLVALVVLDEPQDHYYATETAAPAFREIMRASLLRERVPPQDSKVRLLQMANRSSIEALSATAKTDFERPTATLPERNEHSQIRIPDLHGMTMREALRMLAGQPVRIDVAGSGFLKEQIPPADQWLEAGAKIRLVFQP